MKKRCTALLYGGGTAKAFFVLPSLTFPTAVEEMFSQLFWSNLLFVTEDE